MRASAASEPVSTNWNRMRCTVAAWISSASATAAPDQPGLPIVGPEQDAGRGQQAGRGDAAANHAPQVTRPGFGEDNTVWGGSKGRNDRPPPLSTPPVTSTSVLKVY